MGTSRLIVRVARVLVIHNIDSDGTDSKCSHSTESSPKRPSIHIQETELLRLTCLEIEFRGNKSDTKCLQRPRVAFYCSYVPNKHNWSSLEITSDWIKALCTRTFFSHGTTAPSWSGAPHNRGFTAISDTPHSVGLLWTSDQPDTETST